MGPKPAPLVPDWEPFTWKNGFVQIVMSEIPCNWFQCQENSCDPVHFEWMHSNWSVRLSGETGPYSPKHVKIHFDEFDYGIIYRRVREDTSEEHPLWKVGRACLWPNALFTGGHFEWRVPIDDTHTLSISWFFDKVPKDKEPYVQNSIPAWWGPIEEPDTGRWISSHVMNQDFIAWVGQGAVTDRSREHLGLSDRGVIMMRKIFFDDMERIQRGEDPKGLIRDPESNEGVQLPIIGLDTFRNGMTREQLNDPNFPFNRVLNGFPFQAGQPEHVRKAFEEALGQPVGDGSQVRRAAE
jgi:5,5'-dehydrodivanillate O-demethylase